jgi:hypothetical protein
MAKGFLAISRSLAIVFLSMEESTPPLKSVAYLCVLDPAHTAGQLSVEEHVAATGGKRYGEQTGRLQSLTRANIPSVPIKLFLHR